MGWRGSPTNGGEDGGAVWRGGGWDPAGDHGSPGHRGEGTHSPAPAGGWPGRNCRWGPLGGGEGAKELHRSTQICSPTKHLITVCEIRRDDNRGRDTAIEIKESKKDVVGDP